MTSPATQGFRVRAASRADIPALVACSTTSTSEVEDQGFGRPWSERTFTDAARLSAKWREPNFVGTEEILVGEDEQGIVGFVTVEERPNELELNTIEISKEYQRKGFGSLLLRFVEDRARREGKQAVTLGTSRNAAGIAWKSLGWWQSRGFSITEEVENAWTRSIGKGVKEIRMRKDLL